MLSRSSEAPASMISRTAVNAGVTSGNSPSSVTVRPSISPKGFAAAVQTFCRSGTFGVKGLSVAVTRVAAEAPKMSYRGCTSLRSGRRSSPPTCISRQGRQSAP